MTGIVQQCAQDANNQISAANAQVQAANNQTAAANATIANTAASLSTLQGQADENGMISAESLSAVIGSLTQALMESVQTVIQVRHRRLSVQFLTSWHLHRHH